MTAGPPAPAYGRASLAEVLPAVLQGLGVPDASYGSELRTPPADRVVLVLVDGLGWNALQAAGSAGAPFLTSLLDHPGSRSITSVFPSTTPVALTSLGTGLAPGEHGLVGLRLRLAGTGQVVDTLALPAQTDLRALQPRPTVFERAADAGVEVTRVGPRAFDGAGLTEAGLRGGRYAAAESVGERVVDAVRAAGRGDRSLVYLYLGDLDATGHRRGCGSEAWREELAHLDGVLERLADALPTGTEMLVTSDHGMVDVSVDRRYDVAALPDLAAGVETVTGDMRAVHVHALPGAADDVRTAWAAGVGADFWVLSRQEAVDAGLFGRVEDGVLARIGDVVAVARGAAAVVDSRVMPATLLGLVGLHGSVTDDELLVPLLRCGAAPG